MFDLSDVVFSKRSYFNNISPSIVLRHDSDLHYRFDFWIAFLDIQYLFCSISFL